MNKTKKQVILEFDGDSVVASISSELTIRQAITTMALIKHSVHLKDVHQEQEFDLAVDSCYKMVKTLEKLEKESEKNNAFSV